MSLTTEIHRAVLDLFKTIASSTPKPKDNIEPLLLNAFIWDEIARVADRQSKLAWTDIESNELYIKKALPQGESIINETPTFLLTSKVSAPVRRFNADELARLLHEQRKVPIGVTKSLVEQSKLPSNPTVSLNVVERGKEQPK